MTEDRDRLAARRNEKPTGLIGGVEKRDVILSPYNPHWQDRFKEHAGRIAAALEETVSGIEHIGSTAVPGLAAKPIIDILLIVPDTEDEDSYLPQLEDAGYQLRVREPEFHGHRMFRTPERDVHVHVFPKGSPEVERYLLLRDRLRREPAERKRYEDTKRRLAQQDWADMNAYAEAKTDIIESLIDAERHYRRLKREREQVH